jgi:hypothetical protein
MLKQLDKLHERIIELSGELDAYHIGGDDLDGLEDYVRKLDEIEDAGVELQEAGNRLIERLEELQENMENIDAEDFEDDDYEDA